MASSTRAVAAPSEIRKYPSPPSPKKVPGEKQTPVDSSISVANASDVHLSGTGAHTYSDARGGCALMPMAANPSSTISRRRA
jgi:hypothetical protein